MATLREREIPVTVYTATQVRGTMLYPATGIPLTPDRALGARNFAAGVVTRRAAGNGVVTSGASGAPAAYPGHGGGTAGAAALIPGTRHVSDRDASPQVARTPAYMFSRSVRHDARILARRGKTWTAPYDGTGAGSGLPNPDADGAPRPAYQAISRFYNRTYGTDGTRGLDNAGPHAATAAGTRRYPLGTQGAPWTAIYGGTPGLYHPYAARGVTLGPSGARYALPGDGSGFPAGAMLAGPEPGGGPQKIYGGAPHGLHTATVPAGVFLRRQRAASPQMRPGTRDLLANSKRAGQSYSQTVLHLDGSGGGPLPQLPPGRQPGVTARFLQRRQG
jgi:hypothetical protein